MTLDKDIKKLKKEMIDKYNNNNNKSLSNNAVVKVSEELDKLIYEYMKKNR